MHTEDCRGHSKLHWSFTYGPENQLWWTSCLNSPLGINKVHSILFYSVDWQLLMYSCRYVPARAVGSHQFLHWETHGVFNHVSSFVFVLFFYKDKFLIPALLSTQGWSRCLPEKYGYKMLCYVRLLYNLNVLSTLQHQSGAACRGAQATRTQSRAPQVACWLFFALVGSAPPGLLSKKTTDSAHSYFYQQMHTNCQHIA